MATRTQHEPVLLQLPCVLDQVRSTCRIVVQQCAVQAAWQVLSLGTHPDLAPCSAAPCLQGVAYPRPQRVVPRNSARSSACSQLSGVQSSVGLTSAQHGHTGSFGSSSEVELLEIMLVRGKTALKRHGACCAFSRCGLLKHLEDCVHACSIHPPANTYGPGVVQLSDRTSPVAAAAALRRNRAMRRAAWACLLLCALAAGAVQPIHGRTTAAGSCQHTQHQAPTCRH
jgi:hypothetical protein